MFLKTYLLPGIVLSALALGLLSCGSDPEPAGETLEVVQEPTEGIVTTVEEVSPDDWKITDETKVATPADSRLILHPIDGPSDTLTMAQLKMMETADSTRYSDSQRSAYRYGSSGLLWFMLFNRMGGHGLNRNAYANNQVYNNATATRNNLNNSARTTTRTRTGFGSKSGGAARSTSGSRSGGSTRSFGG